MQKNYYSLSTKIILIYTCVSLSVILNAQVGIGTTTPEAQLDIVSNLATGNGIKINDLNTTNTNSSLWVRNFGAGWGTNVVMFNTTNDRPGVNVIHEGTGWCMDNTVNGSGGGVFNIVNGTGVFGVYNSLLNHGGIGSYSDLGDNNGTGYLVTAVDNVTTPTSGGDVFAFDGTVYTNTPTGTFVNGGVFSGQQYGVGHGIIINHHGSQGRNAEFNINNANNTDAAIFAVHLGQGSSVLAQNQNNNIIGTIAVGDFAYTGTDVADHIGVSGSSTPVAGWGIGVEGTGNWYGVFSSGNLGASGTKTFLIDHPEDPANKMLRHFSIESNEVLNMYRGTDVFDAEGRAVVNLPDYYNSINKNPSYQLTPIGAAMPNLFIESEVNNGQFIIGGGIPGKKVSWQITAERNDPYLQQNPEEREVIVDKEGERRGKYLTPQLYGQPKGAGMNYREKQKAMTSKLKTKENLKIEKDIKVESEKSIEEEIIKKD